MKSDTLGALTPLKLANIKEQGFFFFLDSQLNIYHHTIMCVCTFVDT